MKYLLTIAILMVSLTARADRWYKVEVKDGKAVGLSYREKPGPHVLGPEEYPADAVLPKKVPVKYWKKSGNTWVEMDAAEKVAEDDAEKAKKASIDDIKDEIVQALALVCADEFGMTKEQLEAKLKQKLK